jgi:hypothetical protein
MEKRDYNNFSFNIHLNSSRESSDQPPQITRLGEEFQAVIPTIGIEKVKRTPKLLWNPTRFEESAIEDYLNSIVHYLGDGPRNHIKSLMLLERFEDDVQRTLENIRKNKRYYQKQLKMVKIRETETNVKDFKKASSGLEFP